MIRPVWTVLGVIVLGAGVLIAGRTARREHPGAVPYALVAMLLAGLGATIALGRSGAVPIELDAVSELLLIGGYAFVSLLWIAFVFEYTGRGPAITPWRWVVIVVLGGLTVASTAVTWGQQTGRIRLGLLGQLSYLTTFGLQVTVFSLGLLGVILLVRSAVAYDDLPLGSAVAFVFAGVGISFLPLSIGYGGRVGGASIYGVVFLQLIAIIAVFAWISFGTDAFERAAAAGHLARETALDAMSAPVIVVDRTGRLLDVNRAAADTFGVGTTRLRDQSLADVVDIPEDPSVEQPITLKTTAGRREFVVDRTAIDEGRGRAYRFEDVTDRRTREQRIQVLNRVIRHNLRNDLDAIRGFAEPIRDGELPAAEASQYVDRIGTLASGLVELADAVERSERVLTEARLDREACDLVAIVRSVADGGVDGDITLDTPASVKLRSDRDAIELVVVELLENAVTHTDRETPSVTIRVRSTAAGGRIEVADDGPGIPPEERAVLLDGEETPVRHGSGIGLWLVYWTVTRLGGDLSFGDREPRGSVVVVDLPDFATSSRPERTAEGA
ncbi:Signal transduction histidine kinase, contains PAS domain [Halorhabdus sp. SVX81]|uniref:ATP-binding protein n=1 Tax=Halorhabdus sp. SVX81 TaxID=2978283 RepID=UPI0023D9AB36|nr:ATP-binding protein [Halorhabdus sp. SVX81]WEL18974.1 Signal transduction histidine kinase, contains PAS domain [Halorhabdus sp. SVX81]